MNNMYKTTDYSKDISPQNKYSTPPQQEPAGRLVLKTKITVKKFANEEDRQNNRPYEVQVEEGNLGLNEGIQAALNLMIGAGGNAWTNALSTIGVGDSTTTASAADVGLIAATGPTSQEHHVMDATTYPSRSSQTISFKSTFGSTEANFAWNEFTVVSATYDGNPTGANLIRKVSQQGTKVSGQSWEVTIAITMS